MKPLAYDLVPTKRALAVRLGAVEAGRRQSVEIWKHQQGLTVTVGEVLDEGETDV